MVKWSDKEAFERICNLVASSTNYNWQGKASMLRVLMKIKDTAKIKDFVN